MEPSESTPRQFDRRGVRWLARDGGIALILALAISAVLLGMQPPITQGLDYQLMHQPYKFYLRASIRAGELPLWNPYAALGRPFLADMETATFYPPNWIFIVLPEVPALFLFLTFHFWLAGFFFIKLARRWSAPRDAAIALAFAYLISGPLLGRLQDGLLGYFCGLTYWPVLFYLVEQLRQKIGWSPWVALVLAVSGSFLTGHPQCFWLTAVGLGSYTFGVHLVSPWRQNIRGGLFCLAALSGAYVVALMLCAVQLLPMIDLMLQGNRGSSDVGFSSYGSLGWDAFTSMFISQPTSPYITWGEANLHVGVICALAGLIGLAQWRDARVRGLWLMGGIGFVLAVGERTPLFSIIFHLLPGMGAFRIAARYATFAPWAFLLAAMIAWAEGKVSRRKMLLALTALLAGTAYIAWESRFFWGSALASAALLAGIFFAGLRMGCPGDREIRRTPRRVLLALLAANSLAAAMHMRTYYQHRPNANPAIVAADMLRRKNLYTANGVPPRLFVPSYLVWPNSGMKYGFSNVTYFGSLTSMRVWTYLSLGAGLSLDDRRNTFFPDEISRAGPFPFPGMNIDAGLIYGTNKFISNPHPGARAYLVHAWKQEPDWTSSLQQMVQNHADPTTVALLEAPAEGPPPVADDTSRDEAVIDAFHRNSVELHVHSSAPALLVVAEAWYPGWRATVNGVSAEVLPANVWMRAVRVPAGESQVELHYVEPDLARGAAFSLCALLVLVVIGWRVRRVSCRIATMS
jgi:hypothetical protein